MTSPRARRRIGLFIAGGVYDYQSDLMVGVHQECERLDYDLYCYAGGDLSWKDPRAYVYSLATPQELDGVILVPGTWGAAYESAEVQALIERFAELPMCLIGARRPGVPAVWVDNARGVRDMTSHLIEKHGCRRLAYLKAVGAESDQRLQGFREALEQHGIPVDESLILSGDYTADCGKLVAAQLVEAGKARCDAVLAANDWMAIGLLEGFQLQGIRVPEDVRLCGFDDIDRSRFLSPPLSTIRQSPHLLGSKAMQVVEGLLQGAHVELTQLVPTELCVRKSCGCFGHSLAPREVPVARYDGNVAHAAAGWAAALHGVEFSLARVLPSDWAERLAHALATDLQDATAHRFLQELAVLMEHALSYGDITSWYRVVSQLRQSTVGTLAGEAQHLMRAELLLGRATSDIGDANEQDHGKRQMKRDDIVLRLGEAAADARTALDWKSLCDALELHLPKLDVPGFYIAEGNEGAGHPSRQLFAFEDGVQKQWLAREEFFPSEQLIPSGVRPSRRHSLIVNPLYIHQESLGFFCLELGPKDGNISKSLGDAIGSALKAMQLAQALVKEVTLREQAEQARMRQELDIASRIQSAILPKHPQVPGLELSAAMIPASEVGGDYYDILPCRDGCWLGIGDVAGHGLPAGLVMLMIQSIVSATVQTQSSLSPAQAWATLNAVLTENIRERLRQDEHATLSLLRYEQSGRIRIAGGHEDVLVYRQQSGKCDVITTPGVWVGVFTELDEAAAEEVECALSPGDVLLLYTDGILEAANSDGEHFEVERLQAVLTQQAASPVEQIRDAILKEVREWMAVQDDDITLVVARHTGSPPS